MSYIHKYLIILILPLFHLSCGTISKRTQLIAIDSQPRGLEIKNSRGETLGFTPSVIERPRSSAMIKIGQKYEYKQKCKLDFRYSVIPNAVSVIFSPYMLVSYPIDYIFDSIHICQDSYSFELDDHSAETHSAERKIPRYAILPSVHINNSNLDDIMSALDLEFEGELVDFVLSGNIFSFYNVYSPHDFFNLSNKVVNKIAKDLDLTYVIKVEKDNSQLSFELIDLFSSKKQSLMFAVNQFDDTNDSDEIMLFNVKNTIRKYIHFLPNAFGVASTKFLSRMTLDDGVVDERVRYDRRSSFLGNILNSISMERLENPIRHNDYSFSFYISPSFLSFTKNMIFSDPFTDTELRKARLGYTAISADVHGVLHTPIGAFSTGLGYGGVYHSQRFEDFKNSDVTTFSKWSLGYTAFLTERFYFRFIFEGHDLSKGIYVDQDQRMKNVEVISSRFGYYFPDVSGYLF